MKFSTCSQSAALLVFAFFAAQASAQDSLTISGQVRSASGEPVAGVYVIPEGMSLGAVTKDDGRYSLIVPAARVHGQAASLATRLIGYNASNVSVTLSGDAIAQDFVLAISSYVIGENFSKDPLVGRSSGRTVEVNSRVARAIGLAPLRTEPHHQGEREIRIWISGYALAPYDFYRFVNRAGEIGGEHIRYFEWRDRAERLKNESWLARSLELRCTRIRSGPIFACRALAQEKPDWSRIWHTLERLDVWNMPDEGHLTEVPGAVVNGFFIAAELWDGHCYRAWSHLLPNHEESTSGRNAQDISDLLTGIK